MNMPVEGAELPKLEINSLSDVPDTARIYYRGSNEEIDSKDLPVLTGLVDAPPNIDGNLTSASEQLYNGIIPVDAFSGVLLDAVTYDAKTGLLTVPLGIENGGKWIKVILVSNIGLDNSTYPGLDFGYYPKRYLGAQSPGYDTEPNPFTIALVKPKDVVSQFIPGTQIIVTLPNPKTLQQATNGYDWCVNYLLPKYPPDTSFKDEKSIFRGQSRRVEWFFCMGTDPQWDSPRYCRTALAGYGLLCPDRNQLVYFEKLFVLC
jgi:hypothetical protein